LHALRAHADQVRVRRQPLVRQLPGAARAGSPCLIVASGHCASVSPRRTASMIAAPRLRASSLRKMADTWWSTVLPETTRRAAISVLRSPRSGARRRAQLQHHVPSLAPGGSPAARAKAGAARMGAPGRRQAHREFPGYGAESITGFPSANEALGSGGNPHNKTYEVAHRGRGRRFGGTILLGPQCHAEPPAWRALRAVSNR